MTKRPVQEPTHRTIQKHVEHRDATDIQIFLLFFLNNFLNDFFKKTEMGIS